MLTSIYFDMDGVLADFHAGASKFHNIPHNPRTDGWDWFLPHMMFDQFWKPLRSNSEFWENLPVCSDGMELFKLACREYGDARVSLMTSISPNIDDHGYESGKRAWVRRHIPGFERSMTFCSEKFRHSAYGKVLIDDRQSVCDDFNSPFYGGKAILFPRPWNSARDAVRDDGTADVTLLKATLDHVIGYM